MLSVPAVALLRLAITTGGKVAAEGAAAAAASSFTGSATEGILPVRLARLPAWCALTPGKDGAEGGGGEGPRLPLVTSRSAPHHSSTVLLTLEPPRPSLSSVLT